MKKSPLTDFSADTNRVTWGGWVADKTFSSVNRLLGRHWILSI